ncbi:hypothetical protein JCM3766R1_006894 [Sporobolomyces carnicolor]
MPTSMSSLPPELLPDILSPLVRRQDLYNVCLVCRDWCAAGQRLLYRHIRLFGKDLAIAANLFETLASTRHLAQLVKRLEVRVYPLSNVVKERRAMEELAIAMLKNCENIEELVYTRKGALTDDVFEAIVTLPRLHTFELNAHTNLSPGSWSASHVVNLPPLRSLSLILPDRNVANALPEFFARQRELANRDAPGETHEGGVVALEELSVLCRESTVFNDRVVSSITPFLANARIRSLGFAGCAKLSGKPLLALLPRLPCLRNLALEACNIDPDFFSLIAPSLTSLSSLKLTHPGPRHPTRPRFFPALETLLQHTRHLTAFTLYYSGVSTGGRREWPSVPQEFVQSLTDSVGPRLRKFELSGVLVEVDAVQVLTNGSKGLKDLVLHLGENFSLAHLTACFAPLSQMRTLHVLSQRADVTPDDVLDLAKECSPTLRQVGFRNRVWLLRRSVVNDRIKVSLGSYDLPFWPEALLVVRFVESAAAFGAFRRNKYGAEEDLDFEAEEADASDDDDEEQ